MDRTEMLSSAADSHSDDGEDGGRVLSSVAADPFDDAFDSKSHEQNGGDDDDEEEEEVEVEVEEEIEEEIVEEVEEEIEEEEEDVEVKEDDDGENVEKGEVEDENDGQEEEVEELGGDSSDSIVAPDNDQNDVTQDTESKRHKELLSGQRDKPCVKIEDPENSVPSKPIGMVEDSGFLECAADEEVAGPISEKRTSKSHHADPCHMSIDLPKNEIMVADTGNRSVVSERGLAPVMQMSEGLAEVANSVWNYEEEIKQMDILFGEEIKLKASRSVTPQIRPRSLSPDTEFKDGNKRPAAICDFFAKGWCIKGSSCRFLHIKDHMDNTGQRIAVANQRRELEVDEGPRDIIEGTKLAKSPKQRAPSITNKTSSSHLSSESIPSMEHEDTQSWHQYNEKHRTSLHQRENLTFGVYHANELSSLPKDNPRIISTFKDIGRESCNYRKYASSIVEDSLPAPKNGLTLGYESLPGTAGISLSTYQSKGLSSSHASRAEASNKSQYMFNDYTTPVLGRPLNSGKNAFHLTNTPPSGEYHAASLPRSCSPFSGSEPDTLRPKSYSRDPPNAGGYKTKVFPNDWEPSVPFRPSFFIAPSSISSPGSQYDPLRDSIEQCLASGSSSYIFPFGHGASIQSIPGSELNSAGIGGTSIAEMDNRNAVPNEEMRSRSASLKEITKLDKIHVDQDSRHKSDGTRYKELNVERDAQNNDAYVDRIADGDGQKESKVVRYFRAALVDFVKELVKPTWREGHLSKDAHKMIVKKAVDKVLSTLQPNQIPSTVDAVKQYLSSSRPKVLRLVEGYVEKYGKS